MPRVPSGCTGIVMDIRVSSRGTDQKEEVSEAEKKKQRNQNTDGDQASRQTDDLTIVKEEEVITREKNIHYQFRKSHYPLFPGMPPSMDDPELNYLYGNIPEPQWLEEVWYAKLKEVVDKYSPDLIYFDSWLNYIPDSMRLRFCTYWIFNP